MQVRQRRPAVLYFFVLPALVAAGFSNGGKVWINRQLILALRHGKSVNIHHAAPAKLHQLGVQLGLIGQPR